jgi:hypothetical protein
MTTKEIGEYLLFLARADDPNLSQWAIKLRPDWYTGAGDDPYRCVVCEAIFESVAEHCEVHREDAERVRDLDLVPLSFLMRDLLRNADLGDEDTVVVAGVRCIPRPFAIVLTASLSFQHLRWAFNRLWHDDDGFGDALCAAAQLRGGAAVFIEQQYRSDA